MRTAVLLPMIALATLAHAQIVQSGFEDWTGSLPDGWYGAKSNIGQANVAQVTDNVHGGSSAVRLTNATSSHKRFTTQAVNVTAGAGYRATFWIRGTGQVRLGIYDERAEGSGYSAYNNYVTATSTWTEVTQSIPAGMTTSNAEFIFSIRNTTAPEHLVIDDVTITEVAAPALSIHDIQFPPDLNGNSPYMDAIVATGGIVTAMLPDTTGYFIQNNSGPWEGVYVFEFARVVEIGDSVTFTALVTEFSGLTELSCPALFTIVSSGNAVPEPLNINTGEVSNEALESVLVRVNNATCTEQPSGATFGKYKVDDGTGPATVGKVLYTTTPSPTLGTSYNVTGINYYAYGEYNIQPRMASDVEVANGIAEAGVLATVTVGPNPAADMLTITLGQAAGRRVEYTLTDPTGRTLRTGVITSDRTTLGLEGLANGNYHLTLRNAELRKSIAVQVVR